MLNMTELMDYILSNGLKCQCKGFIFTKCRYIQREQFCDVTLISDDFHKFPAMTNIIYKFEIFPWCYFGGSKDKIYFDFGIVFDLDLF